MLDKLCQGRDGAVMPIGGRPSQFPQPRRSKSPERSLGDLLILRPDPRQSVGVLSDAAKGGFLQLCQALIPTLVIEQPGWNSDVVELVVREQWRIVANFASLAEKKLKAPLGADSESAVRPPATKRSNGAFPLTIFIS